MISRRDGLSISYSLAKINGLPHTLLVRRNPASAFDSSPQTMPTNPPKFNGLILLTILK
jgi:hypothetical protein